MFSIFYLLNRINNFKCELLELKKNQRIISENIILPYILDNKIGFYHNSNFKKVARVEIVIVVVVTVAFIIY